MTATLHKLPHIYRIAWSDGDLCGIVEGFSSRHYWEAEEALHLTSGRYPGVFFWITTCIH